MYTAMALELHITRNIEVLVVNTWLTFVYKLIQEQERQHLEESVQYHEHPTDQPKNLG